VWLSRARLLYYPGSRSSIVSIHSEYEPLRIRKLDFGFRHVWLSDFPERIIADRAISNRLRVGSIRFLDRYNRAIKPIMRGSLDRQPRINFANLLISQTSFYQPSSLGRAELGGHIDKACIVKERLGAQSALTPRGGLLWGRETVVMSLLTPSEHQVAVALHKIGERSPFVLLVAGSRSRMRCHT
jgi:hypothetical protein